MNTENNKGGDGGDVLMHFEIPSDWKGTLRGLFWIFIFTMIFWSFLSYTVMTLVGVDYIFLISGYIMMAVIYLLIRYATIKYDKIKEPMRVWIMEDHLRFKANYEVKFDFYGIRKVAVTIDDKRARLETWYTQRRPNGDTGWIYGLKKDNVEKGKYKYYVEKYWIPSMKLIIQQIKKYNPGVEVEWRDVRKKYR